MKIELKNIKYAAFASEETCCFDASVYLDGKKVGTVSNGGKGSPDSFFPRELERTLDKYAATLPKIEMPTFYGGDTSLMSIQTSGSLIGSLLDDWLSNRELKRLCAKKTFYRIAGHVYVKDEYHTELCKFSPSVKTSLLAKYGPGTVFLNDSII